MIILGIVSNNVPYVYVPPPYNPNTRLLLHFNDSDGSSSIIDSSHYNNPCNRANYSEISTTQSKFGGSSLRNYDKVTANSTSGTDWQLGTNEFTLEGWFYLNNYTQYASMFSCRSPLSFDLLMTDYSPSPPLFNFWYAGGLQVTVNGPAVIPTLNEWHHLAVVRIVDGAQQYIRVYLDGVGGTVYNAPTDPIEPASTHLAIGDLGLGYSGYYVDGYFDELRFTNGEAIYLDDFTPPLAEFIM